MSRVIGSQHAAATYNSLQEAEAGYLLLNILDEPDSLIDHIKRAAGSVILKISYGYNPESHNKDYLIDLIGHTLEELNQAGSGSAFMFDAIPFRKPT
ncbi:Multifunctional cytochrome P450 monooxygenase [Colletotrichum sp. SAR11_239]|nr:Multifunctional cytochrome P450 monooxygenase [Colletotrichum sp. SAR11_239]